MTKPLGFLQDFHSILYKHSKNPPTEVTLIDNIVNFWGSNKDFWFSHEEIVHFPLISTTYEDCAGFDIALLLHYDQLFRHPCKTINPKDKPTAFRFASSIALKIIHQPYFKTLDTWKKVFVLLALRHNMNLQLKYFVLQKVYHLLEDSSTDSLLLRFLQATIIDINTFKNNAGYVPYVTNHAITKDTYAHLLVAPNVIMSYSKKEHYNSLYSHYDNLYKNHVTDKVAVSISGGVDSMIASYITRDWCKKNGKTMLLLHINYNNRKCCQEEINMLQDWASKLESPLYVRTIDEIQRARSSQFRTLYENVTRKIRFSFYEYFNCPIVLGHNKDDCIENIFSNLSKKIHYDNLLGMKSVSYDLNDVKILRPMLEVEKKSIVLFADHHDIPHLEDSTPSWSRRGQMRDVLIPSIDDFDTRIIEGLYNFSIHSMKLSQQWYSWFSSWCSKSITRSTETNTESNTDKETYIMITKDEFFMSNYENLDFWINIWFSCKLPTRPSNKSFQNVIRIITNKQYINVNLNKYFICKNSETHMKLNISQYSG